MPKTVAEINEKIRKGQVVVVTAEEMVDIVAEKGVEKAAREVDVVTTGTFGAMCSSGRLPQLRTHQAAHEDAEGLAQRRPGLRRTGRRGRLHRRDGAPGGRPAELRLPRDVPLRRRARHRGPGRREGPGTARDRVRHRLLPPQGDPRSLQPEGAQRGGAGQPAERLPELQLRRQPRVESHHLHLHGHPETQHGQRQLRDLGTALAALEGPDVPDDRDRHADLPRRNGRVRLLAGNAARPESAAERVRDSAVAGRAPSPSAETSSRCPPTSSAG